MNSDNDTANKTSGNFKASLKATAIVLLKICFLVYTMKFLWRAIKCFFGLLGSVFSSKGSQYRLQKSKRFEASMRGQGGYDCEGCGRRLSTSIITCPYCGYGEKKPKDPDSKGFFYYFFMLPINLFLSIFTCLPHLLIFANMNGISLR